jgi:hypothetical protein
MWETRAVEEGFDMSTAMSRASWLIGMDPAKGRQGSQGCLSLDQESLY